MRLNNMAVMLTMLTRRRRNSSNSSKKRRRRMQVTTQFLIVPISIVLEPPYYLSGRSSTATWQLSTMNCSFLACCPDPFPFL